MIHATLMATQKPFFIHLHTRYDSMGEDCINAPLCYDFVLNKKKNHQTHKLQFKIHIWRSLFACFRLSFFRWLFFLDLSIPSLPSSSHKIRCVWRFKCGPSNWNSWLNVYAQCAFSSVWFKLRLDVYFFFFLFLLFQSIPFCLAANFNVYVEFIFFLSFFRLSFLLHFAYYISCTIFVH